MTDDAQTVRKNVEHLARGCRSDMHHDPTRYAQEIRVALDRLEAERDAAVKKSEIDRKQCDDMTNEALLAVGKLSAAEAARDRLREALERIRDNVGWGDYFACACIAEPDKGHMTCTCAGGLRRIAREALGGHQ